MLQDFAELYEGVIKFLDNTPKLTRSQAIGRVAYSFTSAIQNMGIYHRRLDILMAQEDLYSHFALLRIIKQNMHYCQARQVLVSVLGDGPMKVACPQVPVRRTGRWP